MLEELKTHVARLADLLQDPQTGLQSWCECYADEMRWISDYWNRGAFKALQDAIKKMDEVMETFRHCGSMDTETDGVWQQILIRTMKGKICKIMPTVDYWELHCGSDAAALALYTNANNAVAVLKPIRHLSEVQKYLKDYCWRVDV